MKLMFVLAIYDMGGPSRLAKNLVDCLEKDGLEIVVMVDKLGDKHYPISEHVKLINLGVVPKKGLLAKIANIAGHLFSMRSRIIAESPDAIVSFTMPANCSVLLSLLGKIGKKPKVIITEHSEEMFLKTVFSNTTGINYLMLKNIYKLLMNLLYHRADYIVSASENIGRHVQRLLFVRSDKIRVIHIAVNINELKKMCVDTASPISTDSSIPYIGTVSRLSPEKGVSFLIQGFKLLLDKMDARLIIVGDGLERPRLEKMGRELNIDSKIIFVGWEENPFKYLKNMEVFVLSSLWEGFPHVILEAMACGVPVVASDSAAGVREAIKDGVNGLLIKPASASAISESVYYLLSNKEKRMRIIEEAQKSVTQFDINIIKKQYENLIFN